MKDRVVIDKVLVGWANDHEHELSKQYKKIVKVGNDPDLLQRSDDKEIASYCKNNNCNLLTADGTAYTDYFVVGINTIQITRYGWDKDGDRPIYLIEIID